MFSSFCLFSLLLAPCCIALSAPNCPVISGTACRGNAANTFVQGSSTSEVLAQLAARFCGCTRISGNLAIHLNLQEDANLTEDSFASLYHLREVSGYLQFSNIPAVTRITLPNLRVIRGQTALSSTNGPVSLLVENSRIGSVNLPSLTEISNGGATFVSTNGMCGFLGVNWADILTNGQLDYSMSGCKVTTLDCSSCPSGHCWSSPHYCQTLTKTVCPQGCGRCFQSPGDGSYQCCSALCAAGCSGPTSDQCYACSILDNNGTCVTECPPAQVYDPDLFMLVDNPNYRLASGDLCVQQCAGNLLEYAGACVTFCPEGYTSNNGAKCVACSSGVCPRVCTGTGTDGLGAGNIGQFNSCTIVNGSLSISDTSIMSGANLELLSTIQEVQGYLRIEGLNTVTSFPYLRNLKTVGFPGAAYNRSITRTNLCQPGGYQLYSLMVLSTSLQSIDFSSLRSIQYGGYILGRNPQLCYVGNFSRRLADSNAPVCLSTSSAYRKDPSSCIAAGFVCHPQCSSNSSCWGPNDTQCDGCRSFVYKGRCVAQCSDVVLSPGNSGIYQNNGSGVCEDCDSQCLGGCVNGTDPYHCIRCRNYTLVTQTGPLCVASCPLGTYTNGTMCIPCFQGCTGGCAGPLPYVNLTNGCLGCSYVHLDQLGQQVICNSSGCPSSTYQSSTPPGNSKQLLSIIQDVTTLCLPCNDVCASCTGPGNTSCTTCRYAKRLALCVSGCSNDTEYQDAALNCLPCAAGCIGCSGPSISQCLTCASGSCTTTDVQSSGGIIGIVFGSIVVIFLATSIVLILFIVYRRYEHKVFKNRTQSTAMCYSNGNETLRPPKLPPDATRLIITPETALEQGQVLGSGAFGTVYKGHWRPEGDPNCYEVAIKVLKEETATPQSQTELLREGAVMATMDHINVVRLYCVCMGKQMMLITEFVRLGSLLSYLKNNQATLDAYSMLNFSRQIADGMAYLEEKRMVHRDLAARNVLVHTPQLVKITDFGLTRIIDVGESHYKATGGMVPLRWMAPESIFLFEYTHKSDVWSFGVTIWEILTFGRLPYKGKNGKEVSQLVKNGQQLERPATCDANLYHLLEQCWLHDQTKRPSFSALSNSLNVMLNDPTRYIQTVAMVASYEELKFLQDGLVKYEEIHPPQASSHTDPIIESNFAYDLAPNFKEDLVTSTNSAYQSQIIDYNPGVNESENSDSDYI
uniref:receptor protein-tyrosine kinase n=1 Tax=Ephydatia fluviatilis TaxID=31330 RepID=Q9Y1X8_9METZ|nr:protein tyrosine kinase [Ephydatia fluviatilis]